MLLIEPSHKRCAPDSNRMFVPVGSANLFFSGVSLYSFASSFKRPDMGFEKDERKLVESLKNSDHEAFSCLFRLYGTKVYRFSIGYLKSKEEAEEIVQDTFLKIWQNRSTINSSCSFSGFVFTIAHNLILNRIRKVRNQFAVEQHLRINDLTVSNPTEEKIMQDDLELIRQSALSQLPDKRRIIFELIRENDMSYQQVAEKLNISVKTVEAQMTEALKHFRRKLPL